MAVTDTERATVFYGLNTDRPSAPDNMGQVWVSYDTGDTWIADNSVVGGIGWRRAGLPDPTDYIQFDTSYTPGTHSTGRLYWDSDNHTLSLDMEGSEVVQQIGSELLLRVHNETGSDITNGKPLAINLTTPISGGYINVVLAKADVEATTDVIGLATELIPNNDEGYMVHKGVARMLDTSGLAAGERVWLSDAVAGGLTSTKPSEPSFQRLIGRCNSSHATEGSITVWIRTFMTLFDLSDYTQDILGLANGFAVGVSPAVTVTSDGATITCSVEANGGGDIPIKFGSGFYVWDTTPADTIALTAGTDTSPQRNYIYFLESTKALTVSTTSWPATEYMAIADVMVQSAATVQTYGSLKVHAWTDHTSGTNGTGHIGHLNYWIRQQNATWTSGVLPAFSGSGTSTVTFSTTAGNVLQLHPHTFPSFASPAEVHVVNDPTTPYTRLTNLASITQDSTSGSINNKYFTLVIWGIISEDSGDCHLMVNLPSGSYTTSYSAARSDISGYTNYSIPPDFKGVGFLIWRIVCRKQGGNLTIDTSGDDDIRGSFPGNVAGSSSATVLEFPDSSSGLRIYDGDDDTRIAYFNCGLITTGTSREFSFPDASGVFALEVEEENIYYVGKHGADTNDGLRIEDAFLTFGAAITAATGETPSLSNQFAIVCLDGGSYTEDITCVNYVHIYAPNANITGQMTGAICSVRARTIATAIGSTYAIEHTSAGSFYVYADQVSGNPGTDIIHANHASATIQVFSRSLYNTGSGTCLKITNGTIITEAGSVVSVSGNAYEVANSSGNFCRIISAQCGDGTVGANATLTIISPEYSTIDYLVLSDSASQPPLNMTERSAAPTTPVEGDIYMDDGTNTDSGIPGLRRYNGAAWEDVGGADFDTISPLTTKGDLLVFSTVNTRLPVGLDTYVLTADSSEAAGVKWASAGAASADPGVPSPNTASFTLTANKQYSWVESFEFTASLTGSGDIYVQPLKEVS